MSARAGCRDTSCPKLPQVALSALAVPRFDLLAHVRAQKAMLAFDMPAGFTREEVEAVAALAHLELDASETELFARQLGEILAYAEEVRRIDTTGVPPTASVVSDLPADRADEIRPCLDRGAALANAPDPSFDTGLFKVPRVI
jgi:aspartyl-tRNA(Asn)/glutamyl-tRNA(Gln) amidotransferase subunit C